MQHRLEEIKQNLAKRLEKLKHSRRDALFSSVAVVVTGVAAYFSGGLLAGFGDSIIESVRYSLGLSSLGAFSNLINGKSGKVSIGATFNLAPQPKPRYTPPPNVNTSTKKPVDTAESKPTFKTPKQNVVSQEKAQQPAKLQPVVNAKQPSDTGTSNWFTMAKKAFKGDRSPEVLQWQQRNRAAAPAVAKTADDIRNHSAQQFMSGVGSGFAKTAKAPVQFVAREAARVSLHEQTKTAQVVQTVREFKPTVFANDVKDFVAADFARFKAGQETHTKIAAKAAYTHTYNAIANATPRQMGEFLGGGIADTALFGGVTKGFTVATAIIDTLAHNVFTPKPFKSGLKQT